MNIEKTDSHGSEDQLRELYLEASSERAPERLNIQVLRSATREVRAPGSRLSGWTRPIAWAAMVGLTLGLLLDIAELPQPGPGNVPLDLEADAVARPARQGGRVDAKVASPLEESEHSATRQAPRAADMRSTAETADREAVATPLAPAGTAASEQQMHRQEKSIALEHQRVMGEPDAAAAEEGLADSAEAPVPACRDEDKRSAAQWYACIENLRKAGRASAAEAELEALLRAYPEFTR